MMKEQQKSLNKDKKKSTLRKQQWAKSLSNHFAMNLAIQNPDSPMKKSYDNTYHCNAVKRYDGQKLTSTYCKNRWCYTCNRIRTAININHYAPEISKMGQPFFITLTRPTVSINDLPNQIDEMENCWRLIYNSSKDKRSEAFKNGIFLKGVRSMECTLRPGGKFHYHIHMIVEGWQNAEFIKTEWLKRNPLSSEDAQDVRPADKGALMEVFKYAIKMSVNLQKDTNFKRLDALFQVLKGKRTIATFGGLKAPKIEIDEEMQLESQADEQLKLRLGNEESVWSWEKDVFDWINKDTGEMLIGEELPDKILQIIK